MPAITQVLVESGSMAPRRRWLPREGFTADTVQTVIKNTLLNPFLTLPLWLLARYNDRVRGMSLDYPLAFSRLKICMYLGLARYINGFLGQMAQNNWTRAKFNWSKELVLITGGSDGFGKLLTLMFAEKGVKVVIFDIQKPKFDLPPNVYYIECNLASPSSITAACDQTKSQHGDPTVLLNNAGTANHHTIVDLEDSRLERVVAVNQLALFRVTREFLPAMTARNHGCIVTVASLAGFVTPAGMTDYCSTKAGAIAFHEGLTAELKYRYKAPAVRTVLVTPNFAATRMAEGFVNNSRFVSPTLHPSTVAEAVFDKILSGNAGLVVLPRIHWWMAATVRSWPYWMQKGIERDIAETMRPYNAMPHRDTIDPEILRMWVEGKIKVEDFTEEERRRWVRGEISKEEAREWVERRARK